MLDEMRRAIARKRDGEDLDAATWGAIVRAFVTGRIDDAQMAALLMACVARGMAFPEIVALTRAFVDSGETLHAPDPRTVDKHSSGGVADTASLIVVPLVAACGVPVAKLSGRSLGHTGGTLDKLEAIAGVRTDLSPERFFAIVREAGCAIAAQSDRLVPADKRVYALRDRTATVPSRGLIAASIVSKKIAGGARAIVYDVKAGRGAFLREPDDARGLAETLVALTAHFGRASVALVTDMNEPLGRFIGTGLEAREARDFLSGTSCDPRLGEVVLELGAAMLAVAGVAGDARAALEAALDDGRGYDRFAKMLAAQGATPHALDSLFVHATRTEVVAPRDGFVAAIDAVALGERARALVTACGDGAGLEVLVRTGDPVRAGEPVLRVYGIAEPDDFVRAFDVRDDAPGRRPLVYGAIDARSTSGAATATGSSRSMLESR